MFLTKCILFIMTFVAVWVSTFFNCSYHRPKGKSRKWICKIIAISLAIVLAIVFCILLIVTKWNVFTIPKIILSIAIWSIPLLYEKDAEELLEVFFVAIVIAYIISGLLYLMLLEKPQEPDVKVETQTLVAVNDGSIISGNASGAITFVHASLSENPCYNYYYKLDDGGYKLATIPARSTTIYYLKNGEEPYIKTIYTTDYYINNQSKPATRVMENTKTSYELYVPEGAITNEYQFDGK